MCQHYLFLSILFFTIAAPNFLLGYLVSEDTQNSTSNELNSNDSENGNNKTFVDQNPDELREREFIPSSEKKFVNFDEIFEVDDEYFLGRSTPLYYLSYNKITGKPEFSKPYDFPLSKDFKLHKSDNVRELFSYKKLPYYIYEKIHSNKRSRKSNYPPVNFIDNFLNLFTPQKGHEGDQTRYVQVLIYISSDVYIRKNKDPFEIGKYQAAMWNNVDMMFRQFKNPKIRISVAGIVIALSKEAEPFMYQHNIGNKVISTKTSKAAKQFFIQHKKIIPLDSYDILATITSRPLVQIDNQGKVKTSIVGESFLGQVCDINFSEIIFHDNWDFRSYGLTHEVGHVLGAFHDSQGSAKDCPQNSGKLMGNPIPGVRLNMWSPCSIRSIQKTVLSKKSACLLNKPISKRTLDRVSLLMGKIYNRHYQCLFKFPKLKNVSAYSKSANNCRDLECEFDTKPKQRKMAKADRMPPWEGSSCLVDSINETNFKKGICFRGECVQDLDHLRRKMNFI